MIKKWQKTALYLLIAYTFLGALVLPSIVKSQIVSQANAYLNAKLSIENISFNPFIAKCTLENIALTSDTNHTILEMKSIVLDIELYHLLTGVIHIKELSLQEPRVALSYSKDKTFNLASLLKQRSEEVNEEVVKEEEKTSSLPHIRLDTVALISGKVAYEDFTRPTKFEFTFEDIGFVLHDLDTQNIQANASALRFYTTLGDGGFLDFKTDILSLEPLRLKGSLNFEASKLYTQWKYLQDILNLEVANGKLSLALQYNFAINDINATTIDDLALHLDNLRIKPKDAYQDILTLGALHLDGGVIHPFTQSITIDSLALDNFFITAKRASDGSIDWSEYTKVTLEQESAPVVASKPQEETKPWHVVLKDMRLQKIKANFLDAMVVPNVRTSLDELNLYAQNITLAGKDPLTYQMDMLLNSAMACRGDGVIKHANMELNATMACKDFNVVHYRPYIESAANKNLQHFDIALQKSTIDFTLKAAMQDENILLHDSSLVIKEFQIDKKSTNEELVNFSNFTIDKISLNTKEKLFKVGEISLNSLNIKTKKYKNSNFNLDGIVVPHAMKEDKSKENEEKSSEKPYRVQIEHFGLHNANVSFEDFSLQERARLEVGAIEANVYGIDSDALTTLSYDVSLQTNTEGLLHTKGKLQHTPLKQEGSLELKKVSLKAINPYLHEASFLHLNDGYISLAAQMNYMPSKSAPDLKLSGSFKVQELFVDDTHDNSTLFSLNELSLKPFTLEMFPNRLYIDEVALNAFFLNALVDKNKGFNLAFLMKPKESQEEVSEPVNEPSEPFPIKIAKMSVANGSAKFGDLSLPIPFSTNIHDVNGVIYSITNTKDETTSLDILGEVDRYGATNLKGTLDSSNPKRYTDLKFDFKNLELNSLSGYSASFAGYKIDGGKLYLGLGYHIVDSELLGSNSIIIKKMQLGDAIEDENITKLPLGFIVALLEDGEGVIDIDMPVEGNVDNPDFKYGALVWKTLGNLVLKAVTSPFSFLSAALGIDGANLEYVEFESASATLLPPEKEKLDTIATMLSKRPRLILKVTPTYHTNLDTQSLQKQKLINEAFTRSGITNKEEHKTVMTIDLLEDIYEDMAQESHLDTIKSELQERYRGEAYEVEYLKALVATCSSLFNISEVELQTLSQARANTILEYLSKDKGIDTTRIVLLEANQESDAQMQLSQTALQIDVGP